MKVGIGIGVVLGGAWLAWSEPASACQPDPCWSSEQYITFASTQTVIAEDGVIAFEYERAIQRLSDDDALAFVHVDVVDEDGAVVPGAMEMTLDGRIASWRPAAPITAATLTATVSVDNLGIADPDWQDCHDDIAFDMVLANAGPLPPLVAPAFEPMSSVFVAPYVDDLATLVCCDGAYPEQDVGDCGTGGTAWGEGYCAATTGESRLDAGFSLAALESADVQQDLMAVMVGGDGWGVHPGLDALEVSTWDNQPFCARIDVWSLSRGTMVSTDEVCFGDDVADELGATAIDPTTELDAQCGGVPYTCAVVAEPFGASWDPSDCEDWPSGAADSGSEGGEGEGTGTGTGSASDTDASGSADGADDTNGPDTSASADGSSSGVDQDGATDRGCACNGGGSRQSGALALLVAVAWRRRRRSAAHSTRVSR